LPELRLTRRARERLEALPPALQAAVVSMLTAIAADPRAAGKPLRGRLRGLWVKRVGSYRVLYTIEEPEDRALVIVRAIRHRAVAYRGEP